jgi:hypothetical protein
MPSLLRPPGPPDPCGPRGETLGLVLSPPPTPAPSRSADWIRLLLPSAGSARASAQAANAALWQRCAKLVSEPLQLRAELCRLAARFADIEGRRWLAYSSRSDYAVERLGISGGAFCDAVGAGRLFARCSAAQHAFLTGCASYAVVVELARVHDPAFVESLLPRVHGLTRKEVRAAIQWVLGDEQRACGGDCERPDRGGVAGDTVAVAGSDCERQDRGGAVCARTDDAEADCERPDRGGAVCISRDDAEADCERPVRRLVPDAPPSFMRIRWDGPALHVHVIERTLQFASLLLGRDAPLDQLLAAMAAEASTEIEITVSAEEACRRFGVRLHAEGTDLVSLARRAAAHGATQADATDAAAARAADASSAGGALAAPVTSIAAARPAGTHPCALPPELVSNAPAWKLADDHPHRQLAHDLDARMRELVATLNRIQLWIEDELLALLEEGAHGELGYPSFERFCAKCLGIPRRTAWESVDRARRRRRNDPVACAHADGRISTVQSDLLDTLQSRDHVPWSAMGPWIDLAHKVTVRWLRDAVRWARGQVLTDYRAWSLGGYPPPTEDQLRTAGLALQRIVEDPMLPDPASLLLAGSLQQAHVDWWVETDSGLLLLQMAASIQDSAVRQAQADCAPRADSAALTQSAELARLLPARPPLWWAMDKIADLARVAWAPLVLQNTHDSHPILERELYRCAAPGCTCRRMEDHHLHYKGRGGDDVPDNRAALCPFHHRLGEHGGLLRVRGRAHPDARTLVWEMGIDPQGRPKERFRGDWRINPEREAESADA